MAIVESTETPTAVEFDPLGGVQIVDCDAHFTEPADLWSSRVPESLKGTVPEMRTVDGSTAWYLDDDIWASTGGNTIGKGRQKVLGSHVLQPFDLVDDSSWNVAERLQLMDEMGVAAQIVYPNGVGFASNHIFAVEDLDRRFLILQTYNDFYLDVQEQSGGRILPQAILPIWDMQLTVKEMTRLLDRGIRGFTLSDKPEMLGLPELPEPFFEPMWDLFNESGAVANFHIGSGKRREEVEATRRSKVGHSLQEFDQTPVDPKLAPTVAAPAWRSFGRQRRLAVHSTQQYMSNVRIIVNLCNSNLFDRYPKLKIVSAESGIGWIPFVLEAMEYQFDEMVTDPEEIGLTERRPSEYFADHIWVMFWFEKLGAQKLVEDIGVDRILVETDVPHPTCLYPDTRTRLAQALSNCSEGDRARMLRDNAADLYGLRGLV